MNKFIGFTKRNLLIYFKDTASVIFSMLTPIIVFVLYILFIKGTFVDAINSASEPIKNFISDNDTSQLANGLLLSGIIGSALITVPYNCLVTIVRDRENNVDKDILSTPMKRGQIIISYFMASVISAFLISAVIMTIGLVLLCSQGDMYFEISDILEIYFITLLGAISSTALFMIVVMFFRSSSSSGAFMGILSSCAGFVIGAYIPLSRFSETIQNICNCFPATGITVMLRKCILSGVLENIDTSLNGIDNGMFRASIEEVFSLNINFAGNIVSSIQIYYYVMGVALICILAISIIYKKCYKGK